MRKLVVRCKGDAGGFFANGYVDNPTAVDSNLDFIEFEPTESYTGDIDFPSYLKSSRNLTYEWIYFYGHHGNFRVLKPNDYPHNKSAIRKYQQAYRELEKHAGRLMNRTTAVTVDNNVWRAQQFFGKGKYADAVRMMNLAVSAVGGQKGKVFGPASLSGRNYAVTKKFVEDLNARQLRAKVVILDCCWSAAFIPLLSELLVPKGHIFAYFCSDSTPIGLSRSLKNAVMDAFDKTKSLASEYGITGAGLVQVLYAHQARTVYRYSRFLDAATHWFYAASTEEVRELEEYLHSERVQISDIPDSQLLFKMKQAFYGVRD